MWLHLLFLFFYPCKSVRFPQKLQETVHIRLANHMESKNVLSVEEISFFLFPKNGTYRDLRVNGWSPGESFVWLDIVRFWLAHGFFSHFNTLNLKNLRIQDGIYTKKNSAKVLKMKLWPVHRNTKGCFYTSYRNSFLVSLFLVI